MPDADRLSPAIFPRLLGAAVLFAASFVRAQEAPVVSLKDAVNTEVQARAFTLPRETHAHGWILDVAIREMAWQREDCASRAGGPCQVVEQHPGLLKRIFFPCGIRKVGRRDFPSGQDTGHLRFSLTRSNPPSCF